MSLRSRSTSIPLSSSTKSWSTSGGSMRSRKSTFCYTSLTFTLFTSISFLAWFWQRQLWPPKLPGAFQPLFATSARTKLFTIVKLSELSRSEWKTWWALRTANTSGTSIKNKTKSKQNQTASIFGTRCSGPHFAPIKPSVVSGICRSTPAFQITSKRRTIRWSETSFGSLESSS